MRGSATEHSSIDEDVTVIIASVRIVVEEGERQGERVRTTLFYSAGARFSRVAYRSFKSNTASANANSPPFLVEVE